MTAKEYKKLVDLKLSEFFNPSGLSYDGLLESMHYSLTAGGKRIRPTLVLEFCRISGGDIEKALPVACAIEMLHTYSLIHDDLPCMDNDELRRGKPTNHVVYGECTATLAGDALQAEAFGTIARSELPAENKIACVEILADAVGSDGMCAGQYLDMVGESEILTESELDDINSRKTGALLIAACRMGVAAAGGSGAVPAVHAAGVQPSHCPLRPACPAGDGGERYVRGCLHQRDRDGRRTRCRACGSVSERTLCNRHRRAGSVRDRCHSRG